MRRLLPLLLLATVALAQTQRETHGVPTFRTTVDADRDEVLRAAAKSIGVLGWDLHIIDVNAGTISFYYIPTGSGWGVLVGEQPSTAECTFQALAIAPRATSIAIACVRRYESALLEVRKEQREANALMKVLNWQLELPRMAHPLTAETAAAALKSSTWFADPLTATFPEGRVRADQVNAADKIVVSQLAELGLLQRATEMDSRGKEIWRVSFTEKGQRAVASWRIVSGGNGSPSREWSLPVAKKEVALIGEITRTAKDRALVEVVYSWRPIVPALLPPEFAGPSYQGVVEFKLSKAGWLPLSWGQP